MDTGFGRIEKGNGKYSLKPVIRTYTEATSGAIKGIINPIEAKPYVMAISVSQDTLGTYADTITGEFLLRGVSEGNYTVEVLPIEGFIKRTISDVEVVLGASTDLETINLEIE